MPALLRRIREPPGCGDILISYLAENTAAEALYLILGFERTGQVIEGKVVARLPANAQIARRNVEVTEQERHS
ncbi:MAG TPA: hypothetical protein VF120_07220 [Ktedonobacterales bacterium]